MSWAITRLADHCEVITKGTTPTTLGLDFAASGVPFLRVQNLGGGRVNYDRDTLFIDEKTHDTLERSRIRPGDVLVSIAGTIGRVGVVPDGAPALNCNQAVAIVRTKREVFQPFLRHWLESPGAQGQMRGSAVTGTISNLSLAQVGNLKIPLPSLPEQRRIAEVLDRAGSLRAKRRAALAHLETLSQSIFLDIFGDPATNPKGWPEKELGSLLADAELFVDGDWVESKDQDPSGEVRLIQLADIGDSNYLDKSARFLTKQTALRLKCTSLKIGDVLIARMPDPLGRACIFPGDQRESVTVVDVCIIRPATTGPDAVWLMCGVNTNGFRGRIARQATGTTRERISRGNLSKLRLIAPPIELQRTFAKHFAATRELRAAHDASLAELDVLFATLQRRAFSGDL